MKTCLASLILFVSLVGHTASVTQIATGHDSGFALLDDHSLWGWGSNEQGQLLLTKVPLSSKAVQLNQSVPVYGLAQASSESHRMCAILEGGHLRCWGLDTQGELGLGLGTGKHVIGDEPHETFERINNVNLGSSFSVKKVALGTYHSCALSITGTVKCWGANWAGQLGLGDFRSRGTQLSEMGDNLPTVDFGGGAVVDICAGNAHTCVLLQSGQLKCWGEARGTGSGRYQCIGGKANEMGKNLPTVKLGLGTKVASLTCGSFFNCVVSQSGEVKCWGSNTGYVLGLGEPPITWVGKDIAQMGSNLSPVALGDSLATKIGCGSKSCCVRLDNGTAKCWGMNEFGQLGLGDNSIRGDEPTDMGKALPFLQLGKLLQVETLSVGESFACATLDKKWVKCWGANAKGQLGQGHQNNVGDQPNQMGDNLAPIAFSQN